MSENSRNPPASPREWRKQMDRPCGCKVFVLFPVLCDVARSLETQVRQAIKDRDWERMREAGRALSAHRGETYSR